MENTYNTRAKICEINFYSCYISPSVPQVIFKIILDNLVREVLKTTVNIVAGDSNAWTSELGSVSTNKLRDALLNTFSSFEEVLLNTGK